MDSEDKLQLIMTHIKNNDLDFVSIFFSSYFFQEPEIVNQVLSMNRYDEISGTVLQGESPMKRFGNPLPGDPSIMYTIQKNQLAELQHRFAETMGLVQTATVNYKEMTGQFQGGGTFAAGSHQMDSGIAGVNSQGKENSKISYRSELEEAGSLEAPTYIQNAEENTHNPLLT